MTHIILLAVTAITLLQADQPGDANGVRAEASETPIVAARPRSRADVITMADFYMRDGNAVSGKLISDDSTQVVIEQLHDSVISTRTYSKREIDTRTFRKRPVPEWSYYTQLAEYFAARTWDFRDDPDDFIGAIRCYEKARESLRADGANEAKIAEIDRAIQKLKRDKEVWTDQVESRAKLKKLEYDAEAENRLKQLEKQIAESSVKLNESIKYLDKTAADMKEDYQRLEKSISDLNKDFVRQIQNLQVRIANDEVVINDILFRCCGRPRTGP